MTVVALHTIISEELEQEGTVREIIRVVQDTRKKLDFPIDKRVILTLDVDASLQNALKRFEHILLEGILLSEIRYEKVAGMESATVGDKIMYLHME